MFRNRPDDAQGEFDYLLSNFLRYNATRSPFSIYAHAYWFRDYPYTLDGYLQFIDYLSTLDDVYFVTVSKVKCPVIKIHNSVDFKYHHLTN